MKKRFIFFLFALTAQAYSYGQHFITAHVDSIVSVEMPDTLDAPDRHIEQGNKDLMIVIEASGDERYSLTAWPVNYEDGQPALLEGNADSLRRFYRFRAELDSLANNAYGVYVYDFTIQGLAGMEIQYRSPFINKQVVFQVSRYLVIDKYYYEITYSVTDTGRNLNLEYVKNAGRFLSSVKITSHHPLVQYGTPGTAIKIRRFFDAIIRLLLPFPILWALVVVFVLLVVLRRIYAQWVRGR